MREAEKTGGWYAHYVLFVLVIVYFFNFVDRNILSILAEDIKADLSVTDAEMGFLYGTVFAVFYAVFGIPLARFADVWVRRRLISIGLVFWSIMTALSGLARNFPSLAAFRIGVGIGEASASPAAYSMLADYYSPRVRATVIAIYSSGVYIGGGVGLFLGGWILDVWNTAYPAAAPFGLKGWQVAFMVVGLPGILLAGLVWTLKEPRRGMSEGLVTLKHPAPLKVLATEMAAVVPPFSIIALKRCGGSLRTNLLGGMAIALLCWGLIVLTHSLAQWIALGIGAYITLTWAQSLGRRDRASFEMMFHSKALVFTLIGFPTIAFVTYGTSFWTAPFLLRVHGASATDVGLYVGLGNALGGLLGVTLGGVLADRLKQKTDNGRIYIGFLAVIFTAPLVLWMLYTNSLETAFWLNFFYHIPASMWVSIAPTTANDLVMPRMRATAGAYFILMNTFIGLALGPYVIGRLSDVFMADGMNSGDALRTAIAWGLSIFLITLVCLYIAMRHLPADQRSRLDRARRLGESVETVGTNQDDK